MESYYKELGAVTLPLYQGRQMYMHTFNAAEPAMAKGYEDYLEPVMSLCRRAGYSGIAHMTVDEKVIQPGMSQRRPGAHVDGRFEAQNMMWGGHPTDPRPFWNHYCNRVPVDRMEVIIAASEIGCAVYPGRFEGQSGAGGDCEHLRDQFTERHVLAPGQGYHLSPDCVHESLLAGKSLRRSFLRIALERRTI